MKKLSLIPLALLLGLLPAAAWEKSVNSGKPGPNLKNLRPMHLSFQVNWDGKINSAKTNIILGRTDKRYPNLYIGQIYGNSTGLANTLYPYKNNFTSWLRKSDYRPLKFVASERDKDETRETVTEFTRSVKCTEVTDPHKAGKKTKTKLRTFSWSKAPVYDLISAYLYLRSLDLKTGQEVVMVLHPFTEPYLARIKVLGREVHRGRKCQKLDIQLQKIGKKLELINYDKMTKATLWLSDDVERLPIEIRTQVFIGDVRALLVGRKYL